MTEAQPSADGAKVLRKSLRGALSDLNRARGEIDRLKHLLKQTRDDLARERELHRATAARLAEMCEVSVKLDAR